MQEQHALSPIGVARGATPNPGNRFFAAGPVRDALLAALKQVGPRHEYYAIGLRQFIVLYPEYISREDLLTAISPSDLPEGRLFYGLWAELPFGDNKQRVQIIVDPGQSKALVTSLDDLEAHVL